MTQIEAFVRKNTFVCEHLNNARITPEQCVARQLRQVEMKYFGRKITVNNTIFDQFCRSGCCKIGLVQLRKLAPDVHRVRLAEVKKKTTPCRPLGDRFSNVGNPVGLAG
jgi:hypothetical protein